MEDGPRRRDEPTPELRDELRALQRRAYGPAADIHHDPAALARLTELESLVAAVVPPSSTSTDVHAAPAGSVAGPFASLTDSASEPSGEPETAAPAGPTTAVEPERAPRRPRPSAIFALTAVGALVVAAATTTAITTAAGTTGDVRQVATLGEDPEFQPPLFMDAESATVRGFERFHGLVVMETSQRWLGPGTDACLVITAGGDVSNESQRFQGRMFVGCGAGDFRAATQFTVAPGLPRELIDRYPVGTSLQFVLDGDRVGVFVGEASTVEARAGREG
jgi:hypothetical protein